MEAAALDLFEDPPSSRPTVYVTAFESWLSERQRSGTLRQGSSVSVYRSMWGALAAWCEGRELTLDGLTAEHLETYLRSRAAPDDLSARYAWRLLTLVDAVLSHHARQAEQPRNSAAFDLLMHRPEWRFANASDKTPLPDHLQAQEARTLVAWLLNPGGSTATLEAASEGASAPSPAWQNLRNRAAVALQLGAGLTPSDLRAATLEGVACRGGRLAGLPWKIRLPAHGSSPARESPMAAWAARLLRSWMDARAALLIPGPMLFPATRAGRPWGKVAQYNAAKAVLAAARVEAIDGGSFKLRHTFALRQLRRGTEAEQVTQWLGLADVAALARYRKVLLDQSTEVI
jgi:site-specific recombinase XerD